MKNPNTQIQESNPRKINENKLIIRHIRKQLKSNKDTKTLKTAKRKETSIRLIRDFLATLEIRKQWR